MAANAEEMGRGMLEGFIQALSDKHGQVDLRLQGLTLTIGDPRFAVRVSGTITLAVHMRDLTDAEKEAHASSNIAKMQA